MFDQKRWSEAEKPVLTCQKTLSRWLCRGEEAPEAVILPTSSLYRTNTRLSTPFWSCMDVWGPAGRVRWGGKGFKYVECSTIMTMTWPRLSQIVVSHPVCVTHTIIGRTFDLKFVSSHYMKTYMWCMLVEHSTNLLTYILLHIWSNLRLKVPNQGNYQKWSNLRPLLMIICALHL